MERSFTSELVNLIDETTWRWVRRWIGAFTIWWLLWILFHAAMLPYGWISAAYNFTQGRYEVELPPSVYTSEMRELLMQRYNVDSGYNYGEGFLLPSLSNTYKDTYHSAMYAALILYHRKDIFGECSRDGAILAAKRSAPAPPSKPRLPSPYDFPLGSATPDPYVKPTNPPTVMDLRNRTPPRRQQRDM